jgi:transcriptional regulator with XRE-family HTH domain
VNEALRQAMLRARVRETDVAARLGVDPKTVRRWLKGRVPYPANRAALADLVNADEVDLWPEAVGPPDRTRPDELQAVYPHRWAIPREVWVHFFKSAEREIGILAYSALFLAEDSGIINIIHDRARFGVRVRIVLGDPQSSAVVQRGADERIGNAMPAKVNNALALFASTSVIENISIRVHQTVLYNSLYRSDDRLLVNQHLYGLPAARAPVFYFRQAETGDILDTYLSSFERIWNAGRDLV